MTDINGGQAQVGDTVAIAFEFNSRGVLRKGKIIDLPGLDDYGRPLATIEWKAASEGELPASKSTTVILRNYVILWE